MAPVVPTAERKQTTAPLPSGALNVTPPAPVGPEKTLNAAAEIFQAEVRRANQVSVLDADLQNSQFTTDLLDNPTTGLLTRRGKGVNGIYEEAQTAWQEHTARVTEGLSNDEQRLAFQRLAGSRWATIDNQLNKHIYAENLRYDNETTAAWGKNEIERAARSWQDSEVITSSIGIQGAVLTDYARRTGKPPEWLEQAKLESTSATHKAVLNQMLINGQDTLADAYYKEHQSEIAADDRENLSAKLEGATTDGAAARLAQDVWVRSGPKDDDDAVNLDTLTAEARALGEEEKVIKATIAQLKERAAIHDTARNSRVAANTDAIWEAYDKGRRTEDIYSMQEYVALPGSEKRKVRDQLTQYLNVKPPEDRNTEVALATEAMMIPVTAKPQAVREFKARVAAAVAQGLIAPGTGRTIITDAESALKVDPERSAGIQAVVTRLKEDYKNGVMGEGVEASNEYNKQIEGLYKWSKTNLDRDPSEYYEAVSQPYKAGWVKSVLDYVPLINFTPAQDPKARRLELQGGNTTGAPPVDERVAGAVYDTPKGKMKWTGTGWLPVE